MLDQSIQLGSRLSSWVHEAVLGESSNCDADS